MVGTIALSDGAGERLETIYLGQAPQPGKADFLDRLDGEGGSCKTYTVTDAGRHRSEE